jgi:hypothetical protein
VPDGALLGCGADDGDRRMFEDAVEIADAHGKKSSGQV